MDELLFYYVAPALGAFVLIEAALWWWRKRAGDTKRYVRVASAARAIGYSPAIYAANHGATVLPFFATTVLMVGERGFVETLVVNGLIAGLVGLIVAWRVVVRQRRDPARDGADRP